MGTDFQVMSSSCSIIGLSYILYTIVNVCALTETYFHGDGFSVTGGATCWLLSPALARGSPRVSEGIKFSSCVLVCVFLCLSRCLSGRFNYEELVPHKRYFAGTLLGISSCAGYVSHAHDVIDDVTRSQSRSNFEIGISPSIFELERRSKAQNFGNANGYLYGIFNFRYNFWEKMFVASLKWRPFWNCLNIKHSFNLTSDMKRSSEILPKKVFSWWWRHRWRHMVASNSALYIPL